LAKPIPPNEDLLVILYDHNKPVKVEPWGSSLNGQLGSIMTRGMVIDMNDEQLVTSGNPSRAFVEGFCHDIWDLPKARPQEG
jgi:hypothetical protein